MTVSVGGISVYLTDDTARFQSGFRAAASLVEQSSARMRTATAGAEKAVKSLGASTRGFAPDAFRSLSLSALRAKSDVEGLRNAILAVPALAGGFGGAILAQQVTQRADAYTNLKNRIASVVEGQRDQIAAERDLFEVAQRTRSSLQSNAALFARLRSSSATLAGDPEKLLRTVETVQKSFQVGGATTAESQSAALQLAQALGSGRLQGDELRSILENNIPLAKMIAKEFGVGVGQLKELGAEGTLTADRVIKSILDGSNEIDAIFNRLKPTFAQSLQVLDNSLTRTIGRFDEATGFSANLASGIIGVANNLDSLAQAGLAAGAVLASVFAGRALSSLGSGVASRFAAERDSRTGAAADARQSLDDIAARRRDLQQRVSFLQGELGRGIDTEAPLRRAETVLKKQEDALARSNDRLQKLAAQRESIIAGGRGNLTRVEDRLSVEQDRNSRLQAQVATAGQSLATVRSDPGAQALAERAKVSQQMIGLSGQLGAVNREYATAVAAADSAQARATVSATAMGAAWGAARAVGSSLFSFLGGPWGVALTVVTGAMAAYGISVANAAAEQARFKANAEGIPELLQRIAAAQNGLGNSLRADLNASIGIAVQAQASAATSVLSTISAEARKIDATGLQALNTELGATATRGQGASEAFASFASRAVQTKEGTDRLRNALEALSAARPDLSPAIAEMLRVIGAAEAATGRVNALRNALAGASSGQVAGRKSVYDGDGAEAKIAAANKAALDAAQTTPGLIDESNRRLEVQAKIEERIASARQSKRDARREELKDQILADSRRSGSAMSEADAMRNARTIEGVEFATSEAQKKGRGGGRKGFTPEERFDNKVDLLREQGRAAFFTDLDRELISQLKELKSDPGLAKRTTDAIISGGELPERAREMRAAIELKKSGELAREARDQYGTLSEVLPLVAERQRLLNQAVKEGYITQETANKAVQAYSNTLPAIANLRAGTDRLVDGLSDIGLEMLTSKTYDWKRALASLSMEITKITVIAPLLKQLKDMMSGGWSGGGIGGGGGIFGNLFGGLFGGGGSAAAAVQPSAFGFGIAAANGAALSGGNVIPFALGGVVNRPTLFPMSGGRVGLTGEAGPEGILPLKRGRNGVLGVMASGASAATSVIIGGTTINVQGNADEKTLAAMRAELDARDRQFATNVQKSIAEMQRRGAA
jgi:tape measure domain-containing protein